MIVYRCTLLKHLAGALSGEGAARYGGRWNSKGMPVIYTAESRIMAVLELVIRQPIDKICADFRIVPLEIPETFVQPRLPANWKDDESISRRIGDAFLQDTGNLVIKVPSALLSNSFNYLINPLSPKLAHIKILKEEPILMDKRLLEALRKQ